MYERFTDRARQVLKRADDKAARQNCDYIATEHLLLALLHEGVCVGTAVLQQAGLDLDELKHELERGMPLGSTPGASRPQAAGLKRAIGFTLEEARQLGHNYLGTEHLVLGILREGDSVAAQLRNERGLNLEIARQLAVQLLGSK